MTRLYDVDPHEPSATVHFDWLTAVFPVSDTTRENQAVEGFIWRVLKKLHLNSYKWEELEHGIYTYHRSFRSANASLIIGFSNNSNDFMIQASGSGVESIESTYQKLGLPIADYVRTVDSLSGTFSRVDVCANFFNYPIEYSAWYIGQQAKQGKLVTKSRRCRLVQSFDSKGAFDDETQAQGVNGGWTFYVGKTPLQLRVYNKLAERSDKVNRRYDVDSWSRWEFELNGDQAQGFIDAYLDDSCNLVKTWTDWLASHYRWIEKVGYQAKRSRYPNATWYDKLVQKARTDLRIRTERQLPTFERAENWIQGQVMPTVANMYYARYSKYLANGLSDADAQRLALDKIKRDIDDKVVNEEVNMSVVSAWLSERGIRGVNQHSDFIDEEIEEAQNRLVMLKRRKRRSDLL